MDNWVPLCWIIDRTGVEWVIAQIMMNILNLNSMKYTIIRKGYQPISLNTFHIIFFYIKYLF